MFVLTPTVFLFVCVSAFQARNELSQRSAKLEEVLHEVEVRLDEEEDRVKQLMAEIKKLQARIAELEEQ